MMLEDMPAGAQMLVSATFAAFGQGAFVNRTVGEILWGYDEPLIDFLNSIKPGLLPFKGKFGLFAEVSKTLGRELGSLRLVVEVMKGKAEMRRDRCNNSVADAKREAWEAAPDQTICLPCPASKRALPSHLPTNPSKQRCQEFKAKYNWPRFHTRGKTK